MSSRLTAICFSLSAFVAIACGCMGGDKKKSTSTYERVGDGPGVEVPIQPKSEEKPVTLATPPSEDPLAAHEKEAAKSIPDAIEDPRKPAEVFPVAKAKVAYNRASKVVDAITPKKVERSKPRDLDPLDITVGEQGMLNVVGKVIRVDDGTVVVSPIWKGGLVTGKMFAVSGTNTKNIATDQEIGFVGEYEAYRTAKFGIYTLVVIRKVHREEKQTDPELIRLGLRAIDKKLKAEKELEKAKATLGLARDVAMEKAIRDAQAEATRKFPLVTTGPVEAQIKAKKANEAASAKLKAAAQERVSLAYAEP